MSLLFFYVIREPRKLGCSHTYQTVPFSRKTQQFFFLKQMLETPTSLFYTFMGISRKIIHNMSFYANQKVEYDV